ncbi:hypothetical protein [Rhizobium etli]|uniref:Uncharacterized protein n=1 Tax=Rhizobium etli TaxID=29449 RepID=A0A7W6VI14_RHIET|nr:hypothetical protein [Rhizobium etli]MBB4483485.1 hypothetical protein [Rhizobium etli]MBB4539294.1 hypothetical protein [Rhizobium etli]
MEHTIVQTPSIGHPRLWGGGVQEHRTFFPMSAMLGKVVSTPANPLTLVLAASPTPGDIVARNDGAKTAALEARLASVDLYAVGGLLHSLNLRLRDSARLDRQAARDCDISAQQAAANALRASGLNQLLGTIVTSAFAIAGAGVNIGAGAKLVGTSETTMMTWNGAAMGISELGKVPGACLQMGATIELEEKARLEAEGSMSRSRAEDETEYKSGYESVIRDVLEKLSELRRADAETRSKIASMG